MINPRLKKPVRIAWVLTLTLSLAVLLLALPGYSSSPQLFIQVEYADNPTTSIQDGVYYVGSVLSILATLMSIVLSGVVFWRKPGEPMAVFFSFYLLLYAIFLTGPIEFTFGYWLPNQMGLVMKIQSVFFSLPNVILLLIFPNGRFQPRWSKVLVVVTAIISAVAWFINNDELARPSTPISQFMFGLLYSILLISILLQIYRYRNVYTYPERQQTKWAVMGIVAWFIAMGLSSIPYYYLLYLPPGAPIPWWEPLGTAFWWLTLSILPVAFSIAILRSRLWDIDILIRRTLQYTLLTLLLAIVYFGGVTLMQAVFTAFIGHQSTAAVVISTLTIAALFNPLRRRIQEFIDRRFYRQKYDAEQALASFAESARSETDLGQLSSHLITTVRETLQPERIILWVKQDRNHPRNDL